MYALAGAADAAAVAAHRRCTRLDSVSLSLSQNKAYVCAHRRSI